MPLLTTSQAGKHIYSTLNKLQGLVHSAENGEIVAVLAIINDEVLATIGGFDFQEVVDRAL